MTITLLADSVLCVAANTQKVIPNTLKIRFIRHLINEI